MTSFRCSDGRWGLVLADVSGKGTAAALLMSATRGMLRSLAQTGSGPAEVLTRLNNMMIEDFPSGRFVTMVYAELDPVNPRSADRERRPSARRLLVDPSGHRWINHEHGLPLGISSSKFSETEVTLGDHSRIAFYSDGITEAEIESGEEYGAGTAARPDAIIQTLPRTVCSPMSGNLRMEPDCATTPR